MSNLTVPFARLFGSVMLILMLVVSNSCVGQQPPDGTGADEEALSDHAKAAHRDAVEFRKKREETLEQAIAAVDKEILPLREGETEELAATKLSQDVAAATTAKTTAEKDLGTAKTVSTAADKKAESGKDADKTAADVAKKTVKTAEEKLATAEATLKTAQEALGQSKAPSVALQKLKKAAEETAAKLSAADMEVTKATTASKDATEKAKSNKDEDKKAAEDAAKALTETTAKAKTAGELNMESQRKLTEGQQKLPTLAKVREQISQLESRKAGLSADLVYERGQTTTVVSNVTSALPEAAVLKDAREIAKKKGQLKQEDLNKLSSLVTSPLTSDQATALMAIFTALEKEAPAEMRPSVNSLYRIARRRERSPGTEQADAGVLVLYIQHQLTPTTSVRLHPSPSHTILFASEQKWAAPLATEGPGTLAFSKVEKKTVPKFIKDEKSSELIVSADFPMVVLEAVTLARQTSKALVRPATSSLTYYPGPKTKSGPKTPITPIMLEKSKFFKFEMSGETPEWKYIQKDLTASVDSPTTNNAFGSLPAFGFGSTLMAMSMIQSAMFLQDAAGQDAQPTGNKNYSSLLDSPPQAITRKTQSTTKKAQFTIQDDQDWKNTVSDLKKTSKPADKSNRALDLALTCKEAYVLAEDAEEKAFEKLRSDYFMSLTRNLSTEVSTSADPQESDLNTVKDVYRELQSLRDDLEKLEFQVRFTTTYRLIGGSGGGGSGFAGWTGKTQVIEVYRKETVCENGRWCTRYVPFTIEVPVIERGKGTTAPTQTLDFAPAQADVPVPDFAPDELAPAPAPPAGI